MTQPMHSINRTVTSLGRMIKNHPFCQLAQVGQIPAEMLREWARAQYVDSAAWVPIMSVIINRISEPRLVRALRDNIACEAGLSSTASHLTLCARFLEGVGESPMIGDYATYCPIAAYNIMATQAIHRMGEPMLCGWLLAIEAHTPTIFREMLPAFRTAWPNGNYTYMEEHIEVDKNEHEIWMRESAEAILVRTNGAARPDIIFGIELAGRCMISHLDILFGKI